MLIAHDFRSRYAAFRFDGKPSLSVRSILKTYGFRWNPTGGVWWRARVSGAADVAAAIRDQENREHPQSRLAVSVDAIRAAELATGDDGAPDWSDLIYENDCARRCGF